MGNEYLKKTLGLKEDRSEVYIESSPGSSSGYDCSLAIALKIIGFLNIIAGLIVGISLCGEGCLFGERYGANGLGILFFVASGIIGCIICFALAKCVQAATKYLNSAK